MDAICRRNRVHQDDGLLKLLMRLCTKHTHTYKRKTPHSPPFPPSTHTHRLNFPLLWPLSEPIRKKKDKFYPANIMGDHDPPTLVLSYLNDDRFYPPMYCIIYDEQE